MRFKLMTAIMMAALIQTGVQAAELTTGSPAPEFTLTDTQGNEHSLSSFRGKFVVLEWVNHGCPFVVKHYSGGNMQALQKEAKEKGVVWLSICSSAEGKQGNMSNEEWNNKTAEVGANPDAVLIDAEGTVGKQYNARTTPHMFIINPEGNLIYQGAIDDTRSTDADDIAKSENYVRSALTQALAGEPIAKSQTQPYGCGVKYKD
jgi:peroxiredoxin